MARWDVHFNYNIDSDDRELISLQAEIESYRLSIMRVPMPPMKQEELDGINMIRQIKGTTGIEGNLLSEEEIRRVIETGQAKKENEIEVENAHKTQEFIREYVRRHGTDSKIITENLICDLHIVNTQGLYEERNIPGHYRRFDVSAGDYAAPSYDEVKRMMERFIEVINSNDVVQRLKPLIRSIIAHFYLITIHPFGDGNGRTSRALEAFILYSGGYNVRGFYSLANYHYRHRVEYIEQLNRVRFVDHGNLTNFVKYCMRAFLHELDGVQHTILSYVKQVMYRDYVIELLRFGKINPRMMKILDFLSSGGSLFVDEFKNKKQVFAAEVYKNVTPKTAQRDLKTMIQMQLLYEKDKRLFPNVDLMDQFTP